LTKIKRNKYLRFLPPLSGLVALAVVAKARVDRTEENTASGLGRRTTDGKKYLLADTATMTLLLAVSPTILRMIGTAVPHHRHWKV